MLDFTVKLPILVAIIEIDDLRVTTESTGYDRLEERAAQYRERYGSVPAGDVDGVQVSRDLFRALNIDPTRRRPSSEALLRRVLKDMPVPSVNTLVDVGNWCSLDFLLPLGLYDADRIVGPVELRLGGPDDKYEAIGNKIMNLDGRYLLADDHGPFGSPITDSNRTSVTGQATRTAVFLYAPQSYDADLLQSQAQTMAERIVDICSGRIIAVEVATSR